MSAGDSFAVRAEMAHLEEWATFAEQSGRQRAAMLFRAIRQRLGDARYLRCERCDAEKSHRSTLTKRQSEIYAFVAEFIAAHRYAPSFVEIAEKFSYNSLATVHEHLTGLERKGWIRRHYNESRAIELVVAHRDAA